jgi:hypothetical protein
MKAAATFILNRVFALALIWLALNAYTRSNCQLGGSFAGPFEKALSGLNQINQALK